MNTWLIELSFGPVQGFIAAARSSRDLWSGSRLLSGIARAAGLHLLDAGAQLIYPVESRVRSVHSDENSNLSNVLLAQVQAPTCEDVARIAATAQKAARGWLQERANHALSEWKGQSVAIREAIWKRQMVEALESYAAWSRIEGDDYRAAYEKTKAALAARKNTRDFQPMFAPGQGRQGFGIPKSSFDGLRESVFPADRNAFPRKFRVARGEQLDALGCIKRVDGRSERFTALTRLAADGWLKALSASERGAINDVFEPLVTLDLATRVEGNDGVYKDFPYDGGLLYPERLETAAREAKASRDDEASHAIGELRDALRPIWRKHGRPCPYMAIVVADGDRMGAFIDRAHSQAGHSGISKAIAEFADNVPAVVRKAGGHCIYNGGEDVMALFPLAGVIEGSRELARNFEQKMSSVVTALLGANANAEDRPSLRVGAAICHVQEPLGLIRQRGDAAEKFAKGDAGTAQQGNALGLQLHVRAGHVVPWRARFDATADFMSLQGWCNAYADGSLSGKIAYRIRQAWAAGREAGLDTEVISCEVLRALRQAQQRGGEGALSVELIEQLQQRAKTLGDANDRTGYGRLIDELILARWLTARSAGDLGREDA